MTWKTREEMDDWADMHGYWHWTCNRCGMSGWTDTTPDCACPLEDEPEIEDADEPEREEDVLDDYSE